MDLMGDASETRILTARHITVGKELVPENNNVAINTSLDCHNMEMQPGFHTYRAALQVYGPMLWTSGVLLTLATFILFIYSIRATSRHRPYSFTNAIFILSTYPAVSLCSFIALLVPRAYVITEAVSQQLVMIAMYQMYSFLIADCGGSEQLVRKSEGACLQTRVLPCCCWPCCVIPRPKLDTNKLTILRYLILQMPIIQAALYVIILVLWAEDEEVYFDYVIYIQPFVTISILTGVWGTIMCVRAAESASGSNSNPRGYFLALQMVLIIVKLQTGITRSLPDVLKIPCVLQMHPAAFLNIVNSSMTIIEMLLLSIWACCLYNRPPALQVYGPMLWTSGVLLTLATFILFIYSIRATSRHRPYSFTNAIFILSTYPAVSLCSFIALLVPRAYVITEAVSQQLVMIAMYQMYSFLIADCGGSEQLVRKSEGACLQTRVLPCCCWPCCVIPRPKLDTNKLTILRYLILQMPIIQAALYVIILVLWAEDEEVYFDYVIYIQPFVTISILTGVWGTIMCVRAAESASGSNSNPRGYFLALQMVLIIVKLQTGITRSLPDVLKIPCVLQMHPAAFLNIVNSSMTIIEMLLLSIWACCLYNRPPGKSSKSPKIMIAVLEDSLQTDQDSLKYFKHEGNKKL